MRTYSGPRITYHGVRLGGTVVKDVEEGGSGGVVQLVGGDSDGGHEGGVVESLGGKVSDVDRVLDGASPVCVLSGDGQNDFLWT